MHDHLLAKRYKLLRLLGQGGMGSVHLAEDTTTSAHVAVKVISSRLLASASGDGVRRFRREAKAASAIDSPHIVRVLDSGEDEETGELYIVMEYLEGEDLQRLLERVVQLPPPVALRIAAQALHGLARAHAARIIHRDIKPANLFLARHSNDEITVKLLDFGIAKIKADPLDAAQSTGLTTTGSFLGSPLYMSPEQVQSSKDIDERTDIWSLGATLYCALVGRAPHQHISAVGKLIFTICSTPAPALRDRAPWVSSEIAEIVHRALAIDPEKRFQEAAAMLGAIERVLPDGIALREDMLVGVTDTQRADKPSPSVEFGTTQPANPVATTIKVPAAPEVAVEPPMGDVAELPPPLVTAKSPEIVAEPKIAPNVTETNTRKPTRAGFAVLGLVAVGLGAFGLLRAGESPAPVPVTTAPSADSLPPSAVPITSTRAPEDLRKVFVAVLPSDATVEIDRMPVRQTNGIVEIWGRLGSVHQVRVIKGALEKTQEVIIGENGAVPAKLELETTLSVPASVAKPSAPPAMLPATMAAPSVKPPAPPPTPPPPPAKPEDVLMPSD